MDKRDGTAAQRDVNVHWDIGDVAVPMARRTLQFPNATRWQMIRRVV